MLERIRFALGLFSDWSIKGKNKPAMKGLKDDHDTELLEVSVKGQMGLYLRTNWKKKSYILILIWSYVHFFQKCTNFDLLMVTLKWVSISTVKYYFIGSPKKKHVTPV